MNSGNGGQEDWNYWRRVANEQGANIGMDGKPKAVTSGPTEMTSAEKQQVTATNLARKRVLEVYKHQPGNYIVPEPTQAEEGKSQYVQPSLRPDQAAAQQSGTISAEEWKKYHSAWQNYYQQYYGGYYGKAAQDYVAREKLRFEREQAELSKYVEDDKEDKQTLDPAINVQDDFREQIRKKARKRAKKSKRVPLWPLGVGVAIILMGVLLQYNQVIVGNVMAYMSPGNSVVGEITELDPTIALAVHEEPTLIIPKINVEVPVAFGAGTSIQEMNRAMRNGIAHFSVAGASSLPGQVGNFAVSGHSAGNVYENTNYKFIFSGLTRMEPGDLAYMDYNGVRYTYKITGTKTVDPTDVAALRQIAEENAGKPMITMITCTPLGTSRYRLLVYGEQIYPEVDQDAVVTPSEPTQEELDREYEMPANSDTPFESFLKWITGRK